MTDACGSVLAAGQQANVLDEVRHFVETWTETDEVRLCREVASTRSALRRKKPRGGHRRQAWYGLLWLWLGLLRQAGDAICARRAALPGSSAAVAEARVVGNSQWGRRLIDRAVPPGAPTVFDAMVREVAGRGVLPPIPLLWPTYWPPVPDGPGSQTLRDVVCAAKCPALESVAHWLYEDYRERQPDRARAGRSSEGAMAQVVVESEEASS